MIIVQKFGGSSLADLKKLRRAAAIAQEARRRGHSVVVVVSAAGDSTDELLELARQIAPKASQRELDALLATGEQRSAALMAMMLERLGTPACSFAGWQAGICTDAVHGGAKIRLLIPDRLYAALRKGQIAVVAGFQGVSPEGEVTTLGRGGSDASAVALAIALGAVRCEIYTDVDGVYTADPRLIPEARLLREIDFRDMLALARGGSQVLHPDSVALAMNHEVELWLLPAFHAAPGTHIAWLPPERRADFAGITRDWTAGSLSLAGKGATPELLPKLLAWLEEAGIGARAGKAEEGCVSIELAQKQLLPALSLVHSALFMPNTEE